MKWFKHYSEASESVKLNNLMERYGVEGYARYWLLLELLGKHWDGESDTITLHLRTIAKQLRYYKITSAKEWLNNGQTMGLYEVDNEANVCTFKAPILRELQSKDYKYEKSKRKQNDPKIKTNIKSKDKDKDKDKECMSKNENFSPQHVVDLYNSLPGLKLPKCRTINKTRTRKIRVCNLSDIFNTISCWETYFLKANGIPFLLGQNDRGWKADFTWLVNLDNAIKVTEGRYDNIKQKPSAESTQRKILEMENPYG